MTREEVLNSAKEIVYGVRNQKYGKPNQTFHRIALLWTDYLGIDVNPKDVANMMILLKIARETLGKGTIDCYVDIAGYAACAGEMIEEETIQ